MRGTGKLSFARRASLYGGSSVHSIRIARMFGFAAITSNAFFSIPGVTAFTSTFSPFSTASKCGTSWQPTTMYRCCCVSTPLRACGMTKASSWGHRPTVGKSGGCSYSALIGLA